jgi:hypothetical protein
MAAGIDLSGKIVDDGQVALEWHGAYASYWLLAIRSGAKPGFTTLKLDGATRKYSFANLGRHQRYRFAVLAAKEGEQVCSQWLSATPRAGMDVSADGEGVVQHLATLERLVAMPQDRRLTLYWQLGPGFVDRVVIELCRGTAVIATYELEPEVRSFTIDAARCRVLANGVTYTIRARARFALTDSVRCEVQCTPAPQGEERAANRAHPQAHLVYACLSLAPELDVFGEGTQEIAQAVVCGRCRGATEWRDYTLRCKACRAEFIANQRGDYLDVTKLRFGTCKCCLPRKLLVQDVGTDALRCAHSAKEHLRSGSSFLLIEDLPFGLCQCCRPRRPLVRKGEEVRCAKSNELHRRSGEQFVLVPSAPIFDAAAIDELLDSGLADICASGVTRGRR